MNRTTAAAIYLLSLFLLLPPAIGRAEATLVEGNIYAGWLTDNETLTYEGESVLFLVTSDDATDDLMAGYYIDGVKDEESGTCTTLAINSGTIAFDLTSTSDELFRNIYGIYANNARVHIGEDGYDVDTFRMGITSTNDWSYVYGLYASSNVDMDIAAATVLIEVSGSETARRVTAIDFYDGAWNTLDISVDEAIALVATGCSADTEVTGIHVSEENTITITGGSLEIVASNDGGAAYGIYMGTDPFKEEDSSPGCVTIEADTTIVADGTPVPEQAIIAPAIYVSSGTLAINTESGKNTVIEGDILCGVTNGLEGFDFDAAVAIDFTSADSRLVGNTYVTQSTIYDISLDLGFYDGAIWYIQDNFGDTYSLYFQDQSIRVSSLSLGGGIVDFTQTGDYNRLVVDDTLSGSGTFLVKTDIQADEADQLEIDGTATGEHTLTVTNSGETPTRMAMETWLVRALAGDATFSLGNPGGVVETGLYVYELATRDSSVGGTEWFLQRRENETSSAGTMALALSGMASQYAVTEALDCNLRKRLGELRRGVASGLWARGFLQRDGLRGLGDASFTQNLSGVEIGVDARRDGEHSSAILGLRLQLSHAWQDVSNSNGGNGETQSRGLALYGTWFHEDGWFADLVASMDWFTQDMDTTTLSGTPVSGDYDTCGLGLSAEFGRTIAFENGFFLEPKARLRAYWIEGKDFTLSNGMEIDQDDTWFVTGRCGTLAGWRHPFSLAWLQVYGLGGFVLPISGYQKATIDGVTLDYDYRKETGAYYGIGFELDIAESFKVYGEGTLQNSFDGRADSRGISLALAWNF